MGVTAAANNVQNNNRTAPPIGNDNFRVGDSQTARGLIDSTRMGATGPVDTRALAAMVADAARTNPAAASSAYAAIRSELAARNIGDLSRFDRDFSAAIQPSSNSPASNTPASNTSAGQGMGIYAAGSVVSNAGAERIARGLEQTTAGARILTQNPILTVRWEATTSAWTNLGGFHSDLANRLRAGGIEVASTIHAPPAGSVAKGTGISVGSANNTNGALAENMIAQNYRNQGYNVTQGANRFVGASHPNNVVQGGARVIDVVAERPGADPRMAERLEVESKVGFTRDSGRAAREATHDIARVADNRAARASGAALEASGEALSNSGRALRTLGRVAKPVGLVMDGLELRSAWQADGGRIGENTGRAASGIVAGAGGAWAGAATGAALGSVVPGVGTVIGGVVGGVIGGIAGSEIGKSVFNTVSSWFG
ncbi:glycine zipper domain-containing protein [Sphingorhabdus arenilitoris]|uniref:Glycine zipper domain-containing protein n=1 Tax=Sphingorhabdus arenilitoris TaxID=1490041 RepID=A0ABV8RIJ5_9SPHN